MSVFRANLWKMYLFTFLQSFHFIGGVLVPFFLDWGKISFTQIMILQSFFVFCIFLLEVPTGAIADYFGRKTSLILGAFSTIIAALIYSSYPHFYIFLIAEFFWALGAALLSGADEALIYDSLRRVDEERQSKKIFARYNTFEILSSMIAAPIGSIIAAVIGIRYTMMLMVIPFFFAFIVGFSLKEPKEKDEDEKGYFETIKCGVRYFRNHKELKILAFDKISLGVLIFFIFWLYQPLLTKMNIPIIAFGFVFAAMEGIQIFFMNSVDWLERLFGSKKRLLSWSAAVAGGAFILLGFASYVPLVVFLLLIISGFGVSRNVLFSNYMNKYINSYNRSTVLSTISMIDRLVRAILYPIIGLMVEWSLKYSIIIIGILIMICVLISRVEEEHLMD